MSSEIAKRDIPLSDSIVVGSKAATCYNFIKDNYHLRYNIITGNIEDANIKIDGQYKIISDREINTIFIRLSNINDKISKEFMTTLIFSEFIELYNPLKNFFEVNKSHPRSIQLITDLANTIETDTLNAEKYIIHWGCGMIASIFGSQSPLTLVLAGEKLNTGKTEFFRRLLPQDLKLYYAESTLDGGKDDDILMCKKLIIMDDEFGGKSKKDQRHFKGMTSKQNITVRVPYGKMHIEIRRLCSLCGTSNEIELLSDPYGNRRILPINILSIDHAKYNAIDKTSLFMAFYDLYKSGFQWKFKQEDIRQLNEASDNFHATNAESELIDLHLEVPVGSDGEYMTNTAIKDYLELNSKQKIFNTTKLGIELKRLGFKQKQIKQNKVNHRLYYIKKRNSEYSGRPSPYLNGAPIITKPEKQTHSADCSQPEFEGL